MNGRRCDVCRKHLPEDEGTMIEGSGVVSSSRVVLAGEIRVCNACLRDILEARRQVDAFIEKLDEALRREGNGEAREYSEKVK